MHMQKQLAFRIIILFILALFVAGCGENKLVGTWIGPNSQLDGSAPLITIKQQDDKTFSITLTHLHGTGYDDEAVAEEGKSYDLMGSMNSKDDAVLQVQSNGMGNNNISYNKEKDVIATMLGTNKISEFTRIKDEKDMQTAKDRVLASYKESPNYAMMKSIHENASK